MNANQSPPRLLPRPLARLGGFAGLGLLALTVGGCAGTLLSRAAAEPGAVRTPSGSVLRTLRPGQGPSPRPSDRVQLAYAGRFAKGRLFAGAEAKEPLEVMIDATSLCWREGLPRMRVGEQARLVCAPTATQGEEGPKVPADVTVDFTIELLAVAGGEGEVRLPPGLKLKSLRDGKGERPKATDRVRVHYEGRLADGKVFDSSIARGEPAVFPLDGVVPCWRYALQALKVGAKAELTCPPDLAYGPKGSPPSIPPNATLTFDVELLGIEP